MLSILDHLDNVSIEELLTMTAHHFCVALSGSRLLSALTVFLVHMFADPAQHFDELYLSKAFGETAEGFSSGGSDLWNSVKE